MLGEKNNPLPTLLIFESTVTIQQRRNAAIEQLLETPYCILCHHLSIPTVIISAY